MRRLLLIAFCLSGCQTIGTPQSTSMPSAIAAIPSDQNPRCFITRVVDGDTVKMTCGAGERSVRLMGFDTPETFQPGCFAERALGTRAANYLRRRLRDANEVQPRVKGQDKYDRTLVALSLDGKPLDRIMVEAGFAVYYTGGKRINWCSRLGHVS